MGLVPVTKAHWNLLTSRSFLDYMPALQELSSSAQTPWRCKLLRPQVCICNSCFCCLLCAIILCIATWICSYNSFYVGHVNFGLYAVGQTVNLNCPSSAGNETVWLENGELVATGSGSLALTISPVTDAHHLTVYTCMVNSLTGVQESNITIVTVGKPVAFFYICTQYASKEVCFLDM